jgi:glycosyltransferase involved in cell wall biosynthesis
MSERSIQAVAAVGDAGDPATWSGIPWHFLAAAGAAGWPTRPWGLDWPALRWHRRGWNLGQVLRGRGAGGYQYSREFLERAEATIPAPLWEGRVLTFSQHFPRAHSVLRRGGRPLHYLDATFASFCTADGLAARLPRAIWAEASRIERENLQASAQVVTMAHWAADAVAEQCGIARERIATILPGANLELPADYGFPVAEGWPGRDRPLVLGFVGKDWRRKGLAFLLEVRGELERQGLRAEVRCAGFAPADLGRPAGVSFAGFIDKVRQPGAFIQFLAGCDVGCLFSRQEPLGLSTLEFLRAGVPVAGFAVEGLKDTLPADAGFSFAPGTPAAGVAEALRTAFADATLVAERRARARAWSAHVTWARCLGEWEELLATGTIRQPFRLRPAMIAA